MRFTHKFKATSLIAIALILGACGGGELPSSNSNSSSSTTSSGRSSSSSSSSNTTSSSSSSIATFTITWQNHDGTVLETDTNVPYGSTPTFNKSNPTKTSKDDYDYTFAGWLPAVSPVTENITYIAQFSENLNYIPITNAQELSNIRNNLSGNYRLMNDIDLESNEWTPIGTDTAPFSGILDGKDFTINNLNITVSQVYVGLFGYNYGTIMNLKIESVQINVSGNISSFIYAGSLVAENRGTIKNIETRNGSLYARARGGNNGYVGGIIGLNEGDTTLDNLTNQINLSGENTTNMGGVIGVTNSISTIINLENIGSVSGLSNVGGLVGFGDSTITNSINNGVVNGTQNIGGLVGFGNFTITNSINNGVVTGDSKVGGLVGFGNSTTAITNSENSGDVIGNSYVGGLIGEGNTTTITNSINRGHVSGTSSLGGLVGNVFYTTTITISNSMNIGSVTGTSSEVGGLIGAGNGTITNSTNSGSVDGTQHVGGLIGYGYKYFTLTITITSSMNSGTLSGTIAVGGLIGAASSEINITNSINNGIVSGSSSVGGLIGSGSGTFTNSMNIGLVEGTEYIGGLVGWGETRLFIYYSLNFGNVVAAKTTIQVGGIAGRLSGTNDFEHAYHYGSITSNSLEVTGTNFGTKVTDISTFNLAFFTTTLGWDTEIWDFTGLNIANGVYPTLKNMPVVEE